MLKMTVSVTLSVHLKKIKELKGIILKLKDTISALEEQHTKILVEDKHMTFRIKGFESRKVSNSVYRSNAFYLHNLDGYKICITVYPKGNELGQEEYVSVTVESLKLPLVKLHNFRLKVELLNQSKNSHDHCKYLQPNQLFCSWTPVNLVSHKRLYENSDFVRNDSIYMRVTFAPLANPWMASTLELDSSS